MKKLLVLLLLIPSLCFGDGFFGPYISNALSYTWPQAQTFSGGFSTPSATITGGTINGATIGGTTAAAGTFTSLASAGASFSASAPAGSLAQLASGDWQRYTSSGSAYYILERSTASVGQLGVHFYSADNTGAGSYIYNDVSSNDLQFLVGSNYTMRISETTGNIMVGTTTDNGSAYLQANGPILIGVYTAAGLPACASGTVNDYATVSDASATPTYWGTVKGGGAIHVPVFCSYDGTTYTWVYH